MIMCIYSAGEVGLIVETMGGDEVEVGGTVPQRIASCMEALGALLSRPHAVTASMVLADKRRGPQAPTQDLVRAVANILGIKDPAAVTESSNLAELGMDSLMGAEIKQTLERGFDIVLGVQEIRALTFGKLRAMAGGDSAQALPTSHVNGSVAVSDRGAEAAAEASSRADLVQFATFGELMPEQVLVKLPSAPADDVDARPVFMVSVLRCLFS